MTSSYPNQQILHKGILYTGTVYAGARSSCYALLDGKRVRVYRVERTNLPWNSSIDQCIVDRDARGLQY